MMPLFLREVPRPALAGALLVTTLASCVPELEDGASLVLEPRVLAVQAEPPEAREGESVSLTALVASDGPPGDGSADVAYAFCQARKPLSELGPVAPACLVGDAAESVPLGRGSNVGGVIARDACSRFGPRRPSAEPGQAAGRAADPDPTGGFYLPVTAELSGQSAVLGGVRLDCGLPSAERSQVIDYNRRHRTNLNPRIDRLELLAADTWTELPANAALGVRAGEQVTLRVSWAACAPDESCTGAETYVMLDAGSRTLVERSEALVASWYATAGEFDEHRSEASAEPTRAENVWRAPAEPAAVGLWVVLRDGRGGVGYGAYRLQVE